MSPMDVSLVKLGIFSLQSSNLNLGKGGRVLGNGTWLSSFLQPKVQFALICKNIKKKNHASIGPDDKICYFQAEHGPDSQVVLVIAGEGVDLKAIEEEISKQCQSLPRGDFASKALSHSFTVFARDMVEVSFYFPVLVFIAHTNLF